MIYSEEDVADLLGREEGRIITVEEIRRIEARALRKLRKEFLIRGLKPADLMLDLPLRITVDFFADETVVPRSKPGLLKAVSFNPRGDFGKCRFTAKP